MFRVPKSEPEREEIFYQDHYTEGFTTDCPDEQRLSRLKETAFKGSEKDYSIYIDVIKAVGVLPGDVLFDFGCSWGYGSWQFAQAGFRVYSYEISSPRARYAAEKLDCKVLSETEEMQEKADCFFSAHVIEHLPNPRILWEKASRVLTPNGFVVLFMPNGEPSRAASDRNYHKLWGQVHPLFLSADALAFMARQYGFTSYACTSPYDISDIAASRLPGSLMGDELLFIARAS